MIEVWRFLDGKAGHERQTAGLVAALARTHPLRVVEIPCGTDGRAGWRRWLGGGIAIPPDAGTPDLLLGAGRACQWPLLRARRRHGGRAIYCMRPALPTSWFDLCLVPRHDGAQGGPHVEPTLGALNDVCCATDTRRAGTLVLIGGPSRHHGWDETALLGQLARILDGERGPVVVSDSRRTPPATRAALSALTRPGLTFEPAAGAAADWLPRALCAAATVWVTADSVSMLFEALTAGAAVGLLEVPARRDDRITRIAPALVTEGRVTPLAAWQPGTPLPRSAPLAEATRCATLILSRWPMVARDA